MQRTLQPELLDSLPHDHPDALHNRRDLRVINAITGNHRWLARTLRAELRRGERALELGAGVGEFALPLARAGLPIDALDVWPRPAAWPAAHAWHREDLRTFSGYDRYPAIVGNLILHQFSDGELADLGARLRDSARVIVACEPLRRRASQVLYRAMAPVLGANHVSLHDGHVSIAAGFRADELPRVLGLDPAHWSIACTSSLLGMYRMRAIRRA